jgi:hypothetical protein
VTVKIVAARPLTEVMLAIWSCCGIVGAILLVLLPDQMITVGYAAWIFALTARRSPVSPAALGIGGTAGVAGSLIVYGATATALRPGHWLILPVAMLAAPAAAGWATTWRMPDDGTPGADVPDDGGSGEDGGREKLRQARILQGLAAGVVVGTISALLAMILTGDVMVLVGPVLGAAAGAVGGVIGADHPRQRRTSRTWSGGVFVVHWHGHADP